MTGGSHRAAARSVPGGDVALPVLVLYERALENNMTVMAAYARAHGVALAPHAKTTLAPEVLRRQLAHGAWGITTASVTQAAVAFGAGARRVLVANEVATALEIREAIRLLEVEGRELYVLVDSVAGVELLEEALDAIGGDAEIGVLVELGVPAARSGARDVATGVEVARAAAPVRGLRLAGVEGYEGVISSERTPDALAAVDAYLADLGRLAEVVIREELVRPDRALVSAGGGKYFDRAVEVLGPAVARIGAEAILVLRPGSYVTHDHGFYEAVSPLSGPPDGRHLRAALELWAVVLSVPEPGLAIVGFGKRDSSYDIDLPVPLRWVARASGTSAPIAAEVTGLDDQHCYLRFDPDHPLAVGDRMSFGLSHPCTVLDKWRTVLLVDDAGVVTGEIETAFH